MQTKILSVLFAPSLKRVLLQAVHALSEAATVALEPLANRMSREERRVLAVINRKLSTLQFYTYR
ncbi:hypothetical protein CI238_12211 [Colletotrichum incanum]|uniref:Uncharacterized protein n=1 Tax=Colletotrichum incanum TaxID=1573173 RepID=A0A166ZWR1_COLIC|nr:hypothetical protein CI238_12211 [Colletotrichum incanum]